jgi:hypothetical protein
LAARRRFRTWVSSSTLSVMPIGSMALLESVVTTVPLASRTSIATSPLGALSRR